MNSNQTIEWQYHDALEDAGEKEAVAFTLKQRLKAYYAEIYPTTKGSVAERDAAVLNNEKYKDAFREYTKAESDSIKAGHTAKAKAAIFEAWRTNEATARKIG